MNQHFPIDSNVQNVWHNNLELAVDNYLHCIVSNGGEFGLHSDIYQDYHVCLYSIDINVKEFENKFDLDFDLEDDNVQEMIPYYVDYDFNVVAERVDVFN